MPSRSRRAARSCAHRHRAPSRGPSLRVRRALMPWRSHTSSSASFLSNLSCCSASFASHSSFLRDEGGVVAGPRRQPAAIELDDPRGEPLEERAVVGDEDDRAGIVERGRPRARRSRRCRGGWSARRAAARRAAATSARASSTRRRQPPDSVSTGASRGRPSRSSTISTRCSSRQPSRSSSSCCRRPSRSSAAGVASCATSRGGVVIGGDQRRSARRGPRRRRRTPGWPWPAARPARGARRDAAAGARPCPRRAGARR